MDYPNYSDTIRELYDKYYGSVDTDGYAEIDDINDFVILADYAMIIQAQMKIDELSEGDEDKAEKVEEVLHQTILIRMNKWRDQAEKASRAFYHFITKGAQT